MGYSQLSVGVNVLVNGCLSLHVGPVMNWRRIQGVPHRRPTSAGTSWNMLAHQLIFHFPNPRTRGTEFTQSFSFGPLRKKKFWHAFIKQSELQIHILMATIYTKCHTRHRLLHLELSVFVLFTLIKNPMRSRAAAKFLSVFLLTFSPSMDVHILKIWGFSLPCCQGLQFSSSVFPRPVWEAFFPSIYVEFRPLMDPGWNPRCSHVQKNTTKLPCWMPLCQIEHDKVPPIQSMTNVSRLFAHLFS